MRPPDCFCTRLRKAKMQNFSLVDEFLDRTGNVFDWHLRVYAVLVIQVDAVGFKAFQRLLNHFPDVFWLAVKSTAILVVEAEFACNSDLITNRFKRLPDKLLVCVRAIDFGCIKECDTLF